MILFNKISDIRIRVGEFHGIRTNVPRHEVQNSGHRKSEKKKEKRKLLKEIQKIAGAERTFYFELSDLFCFS